MEWSSGKVALLCKCAQNTLDCLAAGSNMPTPSGTSGCKCLQQQPCNWDSLIEAWWSVMWQAQHPGASAPTSRETWTAANMLQWSLDAAFKPLTEAVNVITSSKLAWYWSQSCRKMPVSMSRALSAMRTASSTHRGQYQSQEMSLYNVNVCWN